MYELDIYTWPAMKGNPVKMRISKHETPEAAIDFLNTQSEPFAYATLQRKSEAGWIPCDWAGNDISNTKEWPVIRGTNGDHPAFIQAKESWPELIQSVRDEHKQNGGAMIDIAHRILQSRWPELSLSERLGKAAAGFEGYETLL